jgi:hypothetical protein
MFDYREVSKARSGFKHLFPNAGEEAHFDFHSQTIHLSRITKGAFDADLNARELSALRAAYATMLHEITHWADAVGTLWGREYLRRLYSVRSLVDAGAPAAGPENEFHLLVDLHDRTRRIMMGRYYRTVHPSSPHGLQKPWQFQLSAGQEFGPDGRLESGQPILFARLLDNSGNALVARQPIVAGALLETTAVWSEIRTSLEILAEIDSEERLVEQAIFQTELARRLYVPDLTVYTSPTHMLANQAKIADIIQAYHFAATLSHIVMNLQDEDFERLKPPADFAPWSQLFDGFRARRDRGFAFAALCVHGGHHSGKNVHDWINGALLAAGLKSAENTLSAARAKSERHFKNIPSIESAERYLLDLGLRVFDLRAAGDVALTPARLVAANLPTPPIFDPEGELIELAPRLFDRTKFDPEGAFLSAAQLATSTDAFLQACR